MDANSTNTTSVKIEGPKLNGLNADHAYVGLDNKTKTHSKTDR